MKKVYLAFYKGKGDWSDKFIRFWIKSKYSHCELIINNPENGEWISASPRTLLVEKRRINYNPDNWDIVDIIAKKYKFI